MSANRSNIAWHLENQIPGTDQRAIGMVYEKIVEISAAEILLLKTAPKELVAAPGTGKVLEFISAVFFLDEGSADYSGGALTIQTLTSNNTVSDSLSAANLLESTDDAYVMLQAVHTETDLDVNEGLELVADADPTTGNGTLKVAVRYCIHDFNIKHPRFDN